MNETINEMATSILSRNGTNRLTGLCSFEFGLDLLDQTLKQRLFGTDRITNVLIDVHQQNKSSKILFQK